MNTGIQGAIFELTSIPDVICIIALDYIMYYKFLILKTAYVLMKLLHVPKFTFHYYSRKIQINPLLIAHVYLKLLAKHILSLI